MIREKFYNVTPRPTRNDETECWPSSSGSRDSEAEKQFPHPPAYCLPEIQTILRNEASKCCIFRNNTFVTVRRISDRHWSPVRWQLAWEHDPESASSDHRPSCWRTLLSLRQMSRSLQHSRERQLQQARSSHQCWILMLSLSYRPWYGGDVVERHRRSPNQFRFESSGRKRELRLFSLSYFV
jgi:hypothetical protein